MSTQHGPCVPLVLWCNHVKVQSVAEILRNSGDGERFYVVYIEELVMYVWRASAHRTTETNTTPIAIMLKVDYTLSIPNVDAGDLSASKAHEFPVNGDKDSHKNYYDGLRAALATARNIVGDELTKWKELVGKDEESRLNGKEEEETEEAE